MNSFKTPDISNVTKCYWCGIKLYPKSLYKEAVCPKCYQLLTDAGKSYQDIFYPAAGKVLEADPDKNKQ